MRRFGTIWLFFGAAALGCAGASESEAQADTATAGQDSTPPGDTQTADIPEDTVESPDLTLPDTTTPEDALAADTLPPAPACDPSLPAIVMAHGFLASGDTWGPHAMRFIENGWCPDHLVAFDWNTITSFAGGDNEAAIGDLDDLITATLARTERAQLVLIGHSAGGGLAVEYLGDPERAKQVQKYIHVGSGLIDAPPGGVAMLNLSSKGDAVIGKKGEIPGATNVMLETEDHFGVATSAASFRAMATFILGTAPEVDAIVPEGPIEISGRGVAFGDNSPAAGAVVAVWPVDPETGAREGEQPAHEVTLDDQGRYGPLAIEPNTPYELEISGVGSVDVHYYHAAFVRSHPLLYLRTLPGPDDGLAGGLLANVPFTKDSATLVAFESSHGYLAGQDTLKLDGVELLTETLASAKKTLIALFLYDGDADETTQGEPITLFDGFPFLGARDTTLPAGGTSVLEYGDRRVAFQRWAGVPDGAIIVIFD